MPEPKTVQMTATDALALCMGKVLASGATNWGKDQATAANKFLVGLFKSGRVDDNTFSDVAGRLGNHSATRQHLEKYGLLTPQKDALAIAIEKVLKLSEAELLKAVS